ncbi:FAD-dependent oxidoreductase, partial [Klebsiella pneumoniae]|uniref:FAD-dependent oxidoreductase n=1 Tax=Klebsiella pneumoniae TaxID=573 RepID=UPI00376F4463
MTIHVTDVAIVGGGMVGGALALGLAQQGFTVTVLEKAAPPAFDPASAPDVRISAISAASVARPGIIRRAISAPVEGAAIFADQPMIAPLGASRAAIFAT